MISADRLKIWNDWYDRAPAEWRFQLVLWPLLIVGALNIMLTLAGGFPFGLLLLLAIAAVAAVRLPHLLGWIEAAPGGETHRLQIKNADWIYHYNIAYESMPEAQRFWVLPTVLIVAGSINMALTIWVGFPFALLFLVALLVLVGIRAPFVHGMVPHPPSLSMSSKEVSHEAAAPSPAIAPAAAAPAITHETHIEEPTSLPASLHAEPAERSWQETGPPHETEAGAPTGG